MTTDLAKGDLDADTAAETASDTEAESSSGTAHTDTDRRPRRIAWSRVLAYGVLPTLALLLALGAGYATWTNSSAQESDVAGIESVRAATDGAIAMLSYKADSVEKDLGAARDRLTGSLKDSYASLTHDVVIPGSKEKHISAQATVPAAASVSATENHAVVLIFVDQTVSTGSAAPTNTASSVRVSLEKVNGAWLISGFDPV